MFISTVAAMSTYYPDSRDISDPDIRLKQIIRLIAKVPTIAAFSYRHLRGLPYVYPDNDLSYSGNFLNMLDKMTEVKYTPDPVLERALDVLFILHADHEQNCGTATMRVIGSSHSDPYSAMAGAAGALFGPLHGGANEAAMAMIQQWHSPDEAEQAVLGMLKRKEKIMGFGHAVYTESDPRNAVIKAWSAKLAEDVGDTVLYPVSLRCEEVMWREKKLFCNADFFHASSYHFMGIPTKLFTPIFVCSRVTGWCAHIFEQRENNRIIRPSAEYTGPESASWIPIEERE
jgi:2-methylcitrate synthase